MEGTWPLVYSNGQEVRFVAVTIKKGGGGELQGTMKGDVIEIGFY